MGALFSHALWGVGMRRVHSDVRFKADEAQRSGFVVCFALRWMHAICAIARPMGDWAHERPENWWLPSVSAWPKA